MMGKGEKMDKRNPLPQPGINEKLPSRRPFKATCPAAIQSELLDYLDKLERRAEILTAISDDRKTSGFYELAEAYRKQALNSKTYAQSIRKLLMDLA
jgi:hypothetical protein